MKNLIVILLFFSISHTSLHADNNHPDPLAIVKTVVNKTINSLKEVKKQENTLNQELIYQLIEKNILPHVDFYEISRASLGKYWKKADDEQKKTFPRGIKTTFS